MENSKNWFCYQIYFLKFVSMQPFDLFFLPPKFKFLKGYFNFLNRLFWHFIIIHLIALQIQTLLLNLHKTLDEYIDYVMIGSIYIYGYSLLCFWQLNSKKLLNLIDFIHTHFRERSARGRNGFEIFKKKVKTLSCLYLQAQLLWVSTTQWNFQGNFAFSGFLHVKLELYLGLFILLGNVHLVEYYPWSPGIRSMLFHGQIMKLHLVCSFSVKFL